MLGVAIEDEPLSGTQHHLGLATLLVVVAFRVRCRARDEQMKDLTPCTTRRPLFCCTRKNYASSVQSNTWCLLSSPSLSAVPKICFGR